MLVLVLVLRGLTKVALLGQPCLGGCTGLPWPRASTGGLVRDSPPGIMLCMLWAAIALEILLRLGVVAGADRGVYSHATKIRGAGLVHGLVLGSGLSIGV